jgi:hypothetical protein
VAEGVTVASKALSITSFPHSASEPKPRLLRLKRKSTGNRIQLRTLWDISKPIFKTVTEATSDQRTKGAITVDKEIDR